MLVPAMTTCAGHTVMYFACASCEIQVRYTQFYVFIFARCVNLYGVGMSTL